MAGARRLYFVYMVRRILPFIAIYAAVWVAAAVGFFLLESERFTFANSMYWSIVTLGTVGYGDIVPTNLPAKALTTVVIFVQVFLLGYLLTAVTTAANEESQRRALGVYPTELTGHIIVLGYSAVGAAAVRELLVQDQKVAVVTERAEEVGNIRALADPDRLYVTYGSPSDRGILERLNLSGATSVIVSTPDDATNMIAALNIRAMNERLRVVVSVNRAELRETLRSAGVTYVASPSDMGGRLCASAAFEPDVAHAVEDFTAADVGADIFEYLVAPKSPVAGRSFAEGDAAIRQATGCLLIGVAKPGPAGEYRTVVNPPFDTPIAPGDAIILIGSLANAKAFHAWFGAEQGR
jgi:voltage-gated potassium channel